MTSIGKENRSSQCLSYKEHSKGEGERKRRRKKKGGGGGTFTSRERERPTPFIKSLLGASAHPPAKSYFYPTMPGRQQRGYEKSDPGGDHY